MALAAWGIPSQRPVTDHWFSEGAVVVRALAECSWRRRCLMRSRRQLLAPAPRDRRLGWLRNLTRAWASILDKPEAMMAASSTSFWRVRGAGGGACELKNHRYARAADSVRQHTYPDGV